MTRLFAGRRWVIALAVSVLTAGAGVAANGWMSPVTSKVVLSTVGVDDSRLHLIGAWDRSIPGLAETINAGSSLRLRTAGDRLALSFDASMLQGKATIWVGTTLQKPQSGKQLSITKALWREYDVTERVDVSSLLAGKGVHELTVVVRDLPKNVAMWRSGGPALALRGVEVGSLTDLQTAGPAGLRMTFLGDSITAGVNQTGGDARLSFAYQTATALYADPTVIGFPGQGVVDPGSEGVPSAARTLGFLSAGVRSTAEDPDVVVVNYGANDAYLPGKQVEQAFIEYLGQIRTLYPGAKLVVLRPFSGDQAAAVAGAVADRRKAGDVAITYVDTSGWVPTTLTTDGVHPTLRGHALAAERLAAVIKSLLPAG